MHFGMFMEFGFREGGDSARAFAEGFDLVDAAEAWGLDCAWLSPTASRNGATCSASTASCWS